VPVVGGIKVDGPASVCHLLAEMGEDHPATVELVPPFAEDVVVEVKVEIGLVVGALADEEISAGSEAREFIEPTGIAGVDDAPVSTLDVVAVGVGFELMPRFE